MHKVESGNIVTDFSYCFSNENPVNITLDSIRKIENEINNEGTWLYQEAQEISAALEQKTNYSKPYQLPGLLVNVLSSSISMLANLIHVPFISVGAITTTLPAPSPIPAINASLVDITWHIDAKNEMKLLSPYRYNADERKSIKNTPIKQSYCSFDNQIFKDKIHRCDRHAENATLFCTLDTKLRTAPFPFNDSIVDFRESPPLAQFPSRNENINSSRAILNKWVATTQLFAFLDIQKCKQALLILLNLTTDLCQCTMKLFRKISEPFHILSYSVVTLSVKVFLGFIRTTTAGEIMLWANPVSLLPYAIGMGIYFIYRNSGNIQNFFITMCNHVKTIFRKVFAELIQWTITLRTLLSELFSGKG